MVGIKRPQSSDRALDRASTALESPHTFHLPTQPSGSARWRSFALIPVLWMLAAGALWLDWAGLQFWRTHRTPGVIVDLFNCGENFGNGAGVVLLITVLYALGLIVPRAIPRLALASLGAGLVADAFKLIIARTRPRDVSVQQNVWETFGEWWPSPGAQSAFQSFPSAHVATAVGLAYVLSRIYPRGRSVFALLAVLVMLQRWQTGAHFLSDTVAGVAIGWGTAVVLYRSKYFAEWCDHWEQRQGKSALGEKSIPAPHHLS